MKNGFTSYFGMILKCLCVFLFCPVQAQIGNCNGLVTPMDGATGVSTDTHFSWNAVDGATGYVLNVGTASGGIDIVENEQLGTVTSYNPTVSLPSGSEIFVSVVPFRNRELINTCIEISFRTSGLAVPQCTMVIDPVPGNQLVPVNANITWIGSLSATGYYVTIREGDADGLLVWDRENVGNTTNAKPPRFKPQTRYFITVIPYNSEGAAINCRSISFTTGDSASETSCANLTIPTAAQKNVSVTTALEWESIPNVDGYFISAGIVSGGRDLVDNFDTGSENNYRFDRPLPYGTTIYIQISTYAGTIISDQCPPISFTTEIPSTDPFIAAIPRFFTPNNDGFRDFWSVDSMENFTVTNVFVYDRYGKLLVQLAPGQKWDGEALGSALPPDSYWYTINLSESADISGYFLLKR